MKNIQDLLDKIGLGIFVVCGRILMITMTSAFVFCLIKAMIDVATYGLNRI